MIEKLKLELVTSSSINEACTKINELITIVNQLQATCKTYATSAEKKRVEWWTSSSSLDGSGQDEVDDFGVNNSNVGSSPTSSNNFDEVPPTLMNKVEAMTPSPLWDEIRKEIQEGRHGTDKDPKLAEAAHEINKIMYRSYSVECSDDCTAAWNYIKQTLTEKGLI